MLKPRPFARNCYRIVELPCGCPEWQLRLDDKNCPAECHQNAADEQTNEGTGAYTVADVGGTGERGAPF